jgi:hypothetical protein
MTGTGASYIDDFSTKIPNALDSLFSVLEGYPACTEQKGTENREQGAPGLQVAGPAKLFPTTRRVTRTSGKPQP